jgi:quercetin dioxygenase-like cupin family protein
VPPGLTPLVAAEPGSFRRGTESGRQRTRSPKRRVVDAAGAGGVWRADDPAARHRPPQLVPSVSDLDELAEELLARAADDETRRAAQVVVSLPDLRSTVVALAAEAELPDNEPGNGASLQVLRGQVTLRTADQQVAVSPGQLVAVPAQRHSIRAEEDSALLLTVPLT